MDGNFKKKKEGKRSSSIKLILICLLAKLKWQSRKNFKIDNPQMSDSGSIPLIYKETSQIDF